MRGHKGKRVGVAEKPQNDWSDSEICEIWTQKHRPIPVILWFQDVSYSKPELYHKAISVSTLMHNPFLWLKFWQ